jgi:hypothetical protein
MNQALGQDNIRSCKNEDVQWMRFHNIHHSKPTMLYINSFPIVLVHLQPHLLHRFFNLSLLILLGGLLQHFSSLLGVHFARGIVGFFEPELDDGVVVGVIVGVNVGASVYSNVIIRSKMLANE